MADNAVYRKFTFTFNQRENKHNTESFAFVPKTIQESTLTIELKMQQLHEG